MLKHLGKTTRRIGRLSMSQTKGLVSLLGKKSHKAGLPPGTLIHVGERKLPKAALTLIQYNYDVLKETSTHDIRKLKKIVSKNMVNWLRVRGIHDAEMIAALGKQFAIHPLTLEDILDTNHRPKVDIYESYIFILAKSIHLNPEDGNIATEQISIVLTEHTVITFTESDDTIFDSVIQRLASTAFKIRAEGADYCTYALLDVIVDNYFSALESLAGTIEEMEQSLIKNPDQRTLEHILKYRNDVILLRKLIWPLREIISRLTRGESSLVRKTTTVYMKDINDHLIHILDTVSTFHDILSGMLEMYLSSVNNKMSEVMKVLTIITTLFIPLSFIAGVYGMNFRNLPGLNWKYGYIFALCIMVFTTAVMLLFFKRKKWL